MQKRFFSGALILVYVGLLVSFVLLVVDSVEMQNQQKQTLSTISELQEHIEKRQSYEDLLYEYAATSQKALNASAKAISETMSSLYRFCDKEGQLRKDHPELDELCQAQLSVQTLEHPERRNFDLIPSTQDEVQLNYGLLALFSAALFLVVPALIILKSRASQNTADDIIQGRKAYQHGYQDGKRWMVEQLIQGIDVLADIHTWLYAYQRDKTNIKNAQAIFEELLSRMENKWRLKTIERVGRETKLDLSKHTLGDKSLRKGEKVYIAEPGWKLDGEMLGPPVVRRRH